MHDSDVVESIAGDRSEGLTEAYDRYADPLYKYCLASLGEQAEAADAVQDTFVIAAARLADLREPDRLRAWLYAVARNECQRIARPGATRVRISPGAVRDGRRSQGAGGSRACQAARSAR